MKPQQKIDSLIERARKLVEQQKSQQLKTVEMESEIGRLKQALAVETAQNQELVNKIKIIKLAQNIGTSGSENAEVIELKRKINEYIKEIDHCITMLND